MGMVISHAVDVNLVPGWLFIDALPISRWFKICYIKDITVTYTVAFSSSEQIYDSV
jgi:hypothetical protein